MISGHIDHIEDMVADRQIEVARREAERQELREAAPLYEGKLTETMKDAMSTLSNYANQGEILVLTTEYYSSVSRKAQKEHKAIVKPATLRGLEKRGLIKVTQDMWRGASIEVLQRTY